MRLGLLIERQSCVFTAISDLRCSYCEKMMNYEMYVALAKKFTNKLSRAATWHSLLKDAYCQ